MLRVFEAFSGIGTQRMALKRLGIEHEVVGISEINPHAIRSYLAIHGETKNFGDISKVNPETLPDFDLFTYSFPCQDLSVAGRQQGMVKGQTRSGLLYECEKIIEAKRPTYLLLENVKNLVGQKFKPSFDEWLTYLESLGYTNYWNILNAKHYGVPQNRERVFVVSILGEHQPYEFPKPLDIQPSIKSILEEQVDEKYYLNQPFQISSLKGFEVLNDQQTIRYLGKELTLPCVCASRGRYIDNPNLRVSGLPTQQFLELNPNDTSNALTTVQKDNYVMEWVIQEVKRLAEKTRKEPIEVTVKPNHDLRPHRLDAKKSGLSELNINYEENCSHVVTTTHAPKIYGLSTDFRIRKLTPLECWRLMGVSDKDFHRAAQVTSATQLYHQAGNAIVVDVLMAIFKSLFQPTI